MSHDRRYKWDEITENHWRKNPTVLSEDIFGWFNTINRILEKQENTLQRLMKIYGRDERYIKHATNVRWSQFCDYRCGPYCWNTYDLYRKYNFNSRYNEMANQGNPMERFEEQRRVSVVLYIIFLVTIWQYDSYRKRDKNKCMMRSKNR